MIPLFKKPDPIRAAELDNYRPALESTQGNILKSHGRPHTLSIFLTFQGAADALKAAIRNLAPLVTSAWAQMQQAHDHKTAKTESLFVGFGLSAPGYSYLGYDTTPFEAAFQGGMDRPWSDSGLLDPAKTAWEPDYQQTLHAMVLLAHADRDALNSALGTVRDLFQDLARISTEAGAAIYKGKEPIEHFGFVDGISQPIFFGSDLPATPANSDWDPSAGTNLVLIKDPCGASDDDCGSYYVFRKLEQDVAGFVAAEADLQKQLQDPEIAGAYVMGRFRDGTPVALSNSPRAKSPPENNFILVGTQPASGADPYGVRCPVSAHTRKANPRGGTCNLAKERLTRIARRGITYGVPGQAHVGVLFQCCQSSLKNQFEFLQSQWFKKIGPPSGSAGLDPVGGVTPSIQATGQRYPRKWGTHLIATFDFGGFVTLKGGGYFFLPSITFLRRM